MIARSSRAAVGWRAVAMALAVTTAPAVRAPAQAPTAFDGDYVGTATPTGCTGRTLANNPSSLAMTVAAGRVRVRSVQSNGRPGLVYTGTVDAAGTVSASTRITVDPARPQTNRYLVLSGSIKGGNLAGTIDGRYCHWSISLAKK